MVGTAEGPEGVGVHATGSKFAGFFDGDVQVDGELNVRAVVVNGVVLQPGPPSEVVELRQRVTALAGELAAIRTELANAQQQLTEVQQQVNTAVAALQARVTTVEFTTVGLKELSHSHSA